MTPAQQHAANTFPGYRIQGDGARFAVRLECSMVVELVDTTTAAQIIKVAQCCRSCNMQHFVHQKREPKPLTIITNTGYRD